MDRPIIFSAPMVRALLAGRKTMTRRIIKADVPIMPALNNVSHRPPKHDKPYLDAYCSEQRTVVNPRGMSDRWCWWTRDDRPGSQFRVGFAPGDQLWVRETWSHKGVGVWSIPTARAFPGGVIYRADDDVLGAGWWPSIHLPRELSRITLDVIDVRVERLQAISEEDAKAEGLAPAPGGWWSGAEGQAGVTPRAAFALLWNSLHGPGAWDADPWVAAISFTVRHANIDALDRAA